MHEAELVTVKHQIAPKTLWVILALIALGALVSLFLSGLLNSSRVQPPIVEIGIATWPGFASGMIGNEKRFFEDVEVKFKIIDDRSARYAAFQNGDIDIVVASVDEFAQSSSQIGGEIVLVTDLSAGGDGIVVKSDIKLVSDLRGKKVAFPRATPSHFLLYKVLQDNGLSPSDIEQVMVDDPGHAAQAFLGGSVDAAVTWEPFLSEVREKGGGHVLLTTRDYPGIIVDVLVASDRLTQDHERLERFLDGWLRSVDYIKQNPDESAAIIARGLGIKNEDVRGMMAGLEFAGKKLNAEFFNAEDPSQTRLGVILLEASEFWRSQGVISQTPFASDMISNFSIHYFGQ